jgi:hypothetical protein
LVQAAGCVPASFGFGNADTAGTQWRQARYQGMKIETPASTCPLVRGTRYCWVIFAP